MVKRDIPVIFYNDNIPAWDAVDKNSEPARIAAIYKNQLDDAERARLRESGSSGERYALRSERRRMAEAAETKKKKRRGLSGPAFFLLIAAIFYFLWMFVQN